MTQPAKDWRALLRTPRSVDADAVWGGVEARRGRRRVLRRVVWGMPLVAAAVLALFLGRGGPPALENLERRDGGSLAQLEAAAQPAQFVLSDGSQIELAEGARLATRSLTGRLFATEVSAGKVTFDVVPNGPRVWEVTAGTTQVRVLGTRFSVERTAGGVQVSVTRGRVLVTGPGVPSGSQQLQAGQSLQTPAPQVHTPQPQAAKAQPTAIQQEPAPEAEPGRTAAPQPTAAESEASSAPQPTAAVKRGAASSSEEGGLLEQARPMLPAEARAELAALDRALATLPARERGAPSASMKPLHGMSSESDGAQPSAAGRRVGARLSHGMSSESDGAQPSASGRRVGARSSHGMSSEHANAQPAAAGRRVGAMSSRAKSDAADGADGGIERDLREADRARAEGQPERAAKLLSRVIAEHPKDARAALAAFTLGELYLGPLGSPLEAARTFERAQKLGLPAALAEQGAARIFEAYGAAGKQEAASNAARAYLTTYPSGSHRGAAEHWTGTR